MTPKEFLKMQPNDEARAYAENLIEQRDDSLGRFTSLTAEHRQLKEKAAVTEEALGQAGGMIKALSAENLQLQATAGQLLQRIEQAKSPATTNEPDLKNIDVQ